MDESDIKKVNHFIRKVHCASHQLTSRGYGFRRSINYVLDRNKCIQIDRRISSLPPHHQRRTIHPFVILLEGKIDCGSNNYYQVANMFGLEDDAMIRGWHYGYTNDRYYRDAEMRRQPSTNGMRELLFNIGTYFYNLHFGTAIQFNGIIPDGIVLECGGGK